MTSKSLTTIIVLLFVILLGVVGFLVFIIFKDKKTSKIEEVQKEKFENAKEAPMLNNLDTKKGVDKKNAINTVGNEGKYENFSMEEAATEQPVEEKRPLTKEEREKLSNPFGVDLTRRTTHKKYNENNKFIK